MAFQISRGPVPTAKKVVAYGPEGIGKTTFAAQFPGTLFIDTEGSTKEYDVSRFQTPTSWQMLLDEATEVKNNPGICKTLVIDTADWAERLCIDHICSTKQIKSIEDIGYGKGYTFVKEEFGKLLNLLTDVVNVGVNVVITAHAAMRKFEQPDELGAYDRWEMKLTKQAAPLLKEWADMLLFFNYRTFTVKENKNAKAKAQGGQRVMYTTHHPCWDAKNRYGLPDMCPLDYEAIRQVIEGQTVQMPGVNMPDHVEPDPDPAKIQVTGQAHMLDQQVQDAMKSTQTASANKSAEKPKKAEAGNASFPGYEIDKAIPKNLRDLMVNDGIAEWDIQNLLAAWGYVDPQMPVREYVKLVNDGVSIIDGFLVPQWSEIRKAVAEAKEKQELPFN